MEQEFFVMLKGEVSGPYQVQQVRELIQSGELAMDGQCCVAGTEEWMTTKELWDSGALHVSVPMPPERQPSDQMTSPYTHSGWLTPNRFAIYFILGLLVLVMTTMWYAAWKENRDQERDDHPEWVITIKRR